MTASTRVGRAFRRLGALVGIAETRGEDEVRFEHHGDLAVLDARHVEFAERIEKTVLFGDNAL